MKRLSLLFTLSIVLLSFGLANAISFEVEVDPSKTFVHPDDMNTYYMGGTAVYLDIKMANNDGIDHTGFSQTHKFYSTNGDGTPIVWNDGGGVAQAWDSPPGGVPSIVAMNGWLDDTPNPGDDGYYGMMAALNVFSWDGSLPDTMNFTCASMTGWLGTNTAMETRYRFFFTVPVAGHEPSTDIVEICVDQSNGGHPDFDWLFPIPVDFGGPYCFEFLGVPNLPPVVNGTPMTATTPHQLAFALGPYTITDAEGDPVSGVGAIDENDNPIGTPTLVAGKLNWTFDPPCSWVTDGLSHTVRFYAECAANSQTFPGAVALTAPVSLTVTNAAPEIVGGCGEVVVFPFGSAKCVTFAAIDANTGDSKNWSYTIAPTPTGVVDAVVNGDGTYTICLSAVEADALMDFVVTVTVADCTGASDVCTATYSVIREAWFGVYIELEDGNNSALTEAKGVVDDDWGLGVMGGAGVYQGQHQYVSVILAEGSEEMHAFDFMIGYDNSALGFVGAYPGDLVFYDGLYEWEYFTYRFGDNCGGACPSGLLKVIGIADQNDGMHHPIDGINPGRIAIMSKPIELFQMDFLVSNDYTLECNFVPISFFWTDCTDNSLAFTYQSGNYYDVFQGISDTVSAFNGSEYIDITLPNAGFPTYYGAPQVACVDEQVSHTVPKTAPIRFVNFYNGGIKILCLEDYDDRGDINLNGLAYEIADAVVFTNYFIHGMAAFTVGDGQGQIAATDVNADGIVLSVGDLVYLIRVITGDILMVPDKLNPNMVEANFGYDGQLVSVNVELGAALFVLEGNVDVSLAQDAAHMMIKSDVVNGNTRALVYSFDKGAVFSGNILNTEGKMISVEAVDYNGSAYKTVVLPTTFSVQNYPNPFNPATTIEMALPVATNWNLTIYNVAGQKVAEFSGFAEAGINNVVWDASASASGIYFYKVTTDNGSMTKKMVLLK
jgi:hypothetical protein